MNTNDSYVFHTDYDEILKQLSKFKDVDADFEKRTRALVKALQGISIRLEPTMNKHSSEQDETVLWRNYQQLQEERLSILDLSHEWDHLEETAKRLNPELSLQIHDAIEELVEHVSVLAETHRAHIDILEIQISRGLNLMTLVASVVVSYLAFWYFFARDFIQNLGFPNGLSPDVNYIITILSLVPIFAIIFWGWQKRIKK
jgi:uncharacterized FlaG/YvyC family protein